jgi:hypothetical protein
MNHRVNRLASVLGALVVLAVLVDLPAAAGGEAQRGVGPVAAAEPPHLDAPGVTPERLSELPAADQPRWHAYLDRSTALAKADQAVIQAEAATQPTNQILKAPNGGDFKLPAKTGDGWYASEDARRLADIILSYQTRSGGFTKPSSIKPKPGEPAVQLYNLRTDPAETTNLAAKHPDKVKELLSAMQANVERGRSR